MLAKKETTLDQETLLLIEEIKNCSSPTAYN